MSAAAKEEWDTVPKNLKEIRAFVKKHNLSVKTNVGGPNRRNTADVIVDVEKALYLNGDGNSANSANSADSSGLPLPTPKKDTPTSKSKEVVAEPDESEETSASASAGWTEEQMLELAESGDSKKVIAWVNEFNLSSKLSKKTLKSIVQDCSKAGKK